MTTTHMIKVLESEPTWESSAQKLVLIELAYRADKKGIVRISQSEIASFNALSRRTVARCFDTLEGYDIIQRVGHGRYRLNSETLDILEDVITPSTPSPKGAAEELERLKAIRQPHQGIVYDSDGWPVLAEIDFEHREGESESGEDASTSVGANR